MTISEVRVGIAAIPDGSAEEHAAQRCHLMDIADQIAIQIEHCCRSYYMQACALLLCSNWFCLMSTSV